MRALSSLIGRGKTSSPLPQIAGGASPRQSDDQAASPYSEGDQAPGPTAPAATPSKGSNRFRWGSGTGSPSRSLSTRSELGDIEASDGEPGEQRNDSKRSYFSQRMRWVQWSRKAGTGNATAPLEQTRRDSLEDLREAAGASSSSSQALASKASARRARYDSLDSTEISSDATGEAPVPLPGRKKYARSRSSSGSSITVIDTSALDQVNPAAAPPQPVHEELELNPVPPSGRRPSLLRVPQRRHTITKVQNILPSSGSGSSSSALGNANPLVLPHSPVEYIGGLGDALQPLGKRPSHLTRRHTLTRPATASAPGSGDSPEDVGTLVLPDYLLSSFTPPCASKTRTTKIEHFEEVPLEPPPADDARLPMLIKPAKRRSPPPRKLSAALLDTADFTEKLQAKLEREALLRQKSDEDIPSRDFAPDVESVPWPSPVLLSPRCTPQRSPRDRSPQDNSPQPSSRAASWGDLPLLDDISRRGSLPSSAASCTGDEPLVRSQQLSLERDFKAGDTIGAGSFGRVITARHRNTGLVVAVKEIVLNGQSASSSSSQARSSSSEDPGASWARECRLCEQLRHPCIVRYLGHELCGTQGGVARLRLFMEYCSGGSIASHLRTYGALEAPVLARYSRQVLSGLEYLHSRKPPVVHRDLKCANLLLTHDSSAKIADFGCSKWLRSQSEASQQDTMVGSVFWTAPEMLRGRSELTTAVDLWSFGCCILEMATGQHPWAEHPFDNIFQACCLIVDPNRLPEIPQHLPEEVQTSIRSCLRHDPAERATPADLWRLPLFSSSLPA